MPAPTVATYSADVKIAAHTEFVTLLDAGAGVSKLKLRTSGDVLLAEYTLDDPGATVNGTTGAVTFAFVSTTATAVADGTVSYGEFCDGDGDVKLAMPATSGEAALSGYIVLTQTAVLTGSEVTILSA